MATYINALILLMPVLAVARAGPIQTTSTLTSDSPIEAQCCYDHTTQASLSISQEDLLKKFEEYVLQTADLTNRSRESIQTVWNTASFTMSGLDDITENFTVSGLANDSSLTAQQTVRLQVLLQIHNYLNFLKDKENDAGCGSEHVFNGILLELKGSLEKTQCMLTQLLADLNCDILDSYIEHQPDPVVRLDQMKSEIKRMVCYEALGSVQDTMQLALASIHAQ